MAVVIFLFYFGRLQAQTITLVEEITLPANGISFIVPSPWDDLFYALDGENMEVLALSAEGSIVYRYGGWGSGIQALDTPVAILAAENSVFVIDQGNRNIVRLDARLNPVSITPLPSDDWPLDFARDNQQRFWVIYEGVPGIQILNEAGAEIDILSDANSGGHAMIQPQIISFSGSIMAVYDADAHHVQLLSLSGNRMVSYTNLPHGRLVNLEMLDGEPWVLTGAAIANLATGQQLTGDFINFAVESRRLVALRPDGRLGVYRITP